MSTLTISEIFDLMQEDTPDTDTGTDYGAVVTAALSPILGAQRKDAFGAIPAQSALGIVPKHATEGARYLKTRIDVRIGERRKLEARMNRGDICVDLYRAIVAADTQTIDALRARRAAMQRVGAAYDKANPKK